jgi:predicted MFS family arabinose efflux permease
MWLPVAAYAALGAANQMLWLTYTPITTDAARHYGVSDGAIGWLAEMFPLLYVVFAVPAGRLIDRRLPLWLGVGAALTAAGALVRLVGDGYPQVLAGQFLVAAGQPLVLNSVTSVSVGYLRPRDRATGIAVSTAGIFAGMLLALTLGATLGSGRLATLLTVQACLAVLAACALCAALRTPRPHAADTGAAVPLRTVWKDGYLRRLIALACIGFAVFIALTTWLQTLLKPAGVSETAAGYLLLAMVASGAVAAALLPPSIARRGRQFEFVIVSIVATAVALIVLATVPGIGSGAVALVVIGVFLLTDLPVLLELLERRAGPAGGTASALLWLAGNAAGLIVAVGVQLLVDHPSAAFAVLAGVVVLAVPLAQSLRAGASRLSAASVPAAPR